MGPISGKKLEEVLDSTVELAACLLLCAMPWLLSCAEAEAAPRRPSVTVAPAPDGHYDEVFEKTVDERGRSIWIVRPQYRDIVSAVEEFSATRVRNFERSSRNDFKKDNTLSVLPLVLLDSEYDGLLKPGIDQRGRAIRDFLKDFHGSGGQPRVVVEGVIPQDTLNRIVVRNLEAGYVGRVPPAAIGMLYGPDIIRDRHGVFRVIEDNSGFIGGLGDLKLALESLYANIPEYPLIHEREPVEFYKTLADRYRARANPHGGKVILIKNPPYSDNEASRLSRLFAEQGIETVTPFTKAKVEFDHIGAWYRSEPGARRERVGFIALEGEHSFLDHKHKISGPVSLVTYADLVYDDAVAGLRKRARSRESLTRSMREFMDIMDARDHVTGLPDLAALEKSLGEIGHLDFVRYFRKHTFEGLVDAILNQRVASSYMPGTNFVNDKEFHPFVEKLIEFYLGEKPILKSVETLDPRNRRRDGTFGGLNEKLLKQVQANQSDYVIKVVDGRGGFGVWVGAKVSAEEFAQGLAAIRAEPDRYKIQPYTALSVISRQISDIRIHSDVPPEGSTFVSDTGWSRNLSLNGNGKVNLSGDGREATVVVRSAAKICELLFTPVLGSARYSR